MAIVSKYNLVDPSLTKRLFQEGGMTAINPNGHVNFESVRHDLAWYQEHGQIHGQVDVADFVDLQYAEHAVGLLGPVR